MAKVKPEDNIQQEVQEVFDLQRSLEETEQALMDNEQFRQFIELQKAFRERSQVIWSAVEAEMIAHNIKSVKGDWGSLTITERTNFVIDKEALPPRYFKKTPDEAKIRAMYQLEGKLPAGVKTELKKFITKRFK